VAQVLVPEWQSDPQFAKERPARSFSIVLFFAPIGT
jgi:hypothetical protein